MMKKIRMELTLVDGVHMIRGSFSMMGRPFSFCSYMIDGMMIDTGPSCARGRMLSYSTQFELNQIVLTHFHEDHSGNAMLLSEHHHVPVYMTEQTSQEIQKLQVPFYRRVTWGTAPHPIHTNWLGETIETPHHCFRVIHTPGHSTDHICLLEEEKGWVFAGDLFLGTRLHYGMRGESILQLIQSIKEVLAYPVNTIFCGHAGVVRHGRKAFEKKLHFLEWLVEETLKLAEQGYDEKQITKQLLRQQTLLQFVSAGELSPIHLVRSILKEYQMAELASK